jgi:hypothetical protein
MNEVEMTRWLMTLRQTLIMQLSAVEKLLGISPTTAEIRKKWKEEMNDSTFDKDL